MLKSVYILHCYVSDNHVYQFRSMKRYVRQNFNQFRKFCQILTAIWGGGGGGQTPIVCLLIPREAQGQGPVGLSVSIRLWSTSSNSGTISTLLAMLGNNTTNRPTNYRWGHWSGRDMRLCMYILYPIIHSCLYNTIIGEDHVCIAADDCRQFQSWQLMTIFLQKLRR
jgi:hypothetical protein